MDCCQCEGIEINFDRKKAAAKLERYRKKGPNNTTQLLVDALIAADVQDHTLLDIGGGIGAIQHEMLDAGVRSAIDFEASSAYIEACQSEAERRGHAERITHYHGNFADFGEDIPSADIVTLERVLCCYHDMPALMNQSCARTNRLLGLVFPNETWWVKFAVTVFLNLKFRMQGNPFRVFVHPTEQVEAIAKQHGFERRYIKKTGPWQVMVFERTA
jgi:magnesium-protoporphyrin O-methyltransferase